MLAIFTILVVLIVGYALYSQGLLTAFAAMVNAFLAGLVTFSFWEPLASELEKQISNTPVKGYEDWASMIVIFCITLVILRVVTSVLIVKEPVLPPILQNGGAAVCGMVTGYLTAGFLVCAMQTLPLPEDFLGFTARVDLAGGARRYLPPDRVWLAMMQRASDGPLATEGSGFDPRGYFELGYLRHRRYGSNREPLCYSGEDIPIGHGGR
jgi:uncharacterized membrane protein required for colicin V production